jgi:hypothetical protein
MLVVNKSAFTKGAVLMVSFCAVFMLIMTPMFDGKTGLQYSDDFFNRLSKNSSDYFDEVKAGIEKQKGKQLAVTATIAKPDPKDEPDPAKATAIANKKAQDVAKALITAGATVDVKDNVLTVKGDLGAMLTFAATKAKDVFMVVGPDADKPENKANHKLLKDLWTGFSALVKPLQKDGKVAEAKALDTVMKKAIEPGYNFYGIEGEPVTKNIFLLTFLLVFYVVYTMWYGYAIFFMFDGIGLSMKKSKKKA